MPRITHNRTTFLPLEQYETPDGIVIFTVPSSDASEIYHPCVDVNQPYHVLCDCPHWTFNVDNPMFFMGLSPTAHELKMLCSHLKQAIEILLAEDRL